MKWPVFRGIAGLLFMISDSSPLKSELLKFVPDFDISVQDFCKMVWLGDCEICGFIENLPPIPSYKLREWFSWINFKVSKLISGVNSK